LLGVLYRAVVARLGSARLHTGHHLVAFGQQGSDLVWGEFADRAAGMSCGRVEADLLVACDGIHSLVRRTLYPDEGPPKWNGMTMWRALTVGEPLLSGRTMIQAGHSRGPSPLNWVGEFKTADDQPMPQQDWEHTARLEDVLEPFAAFLFDFLDVPAMIRGAEVIYQYPMVDHSLGGCCPSHVSSGV
jgi:2-polyprenyl-6-methoxyphenol hydroxylase-like FAD-dependent oxidoreductase